MFVGSPFEGRVIALDRQTRNEIGSLPVPPEGFVLPYILRRIDERHIAVLDAGGLPSPSPFVPANPRIYEYEYAYNGGSLSAELVRTVSFANVLIGFAEDIVPLPRGRYVLSDAVLGAIWVVDSDGSIRAGVGPKTSDPQDSLFPLAFCPSMPQITVGGLPFLFSGSTLPGVAALASRGNTLYFYSPCARGVYSIPISSLFDHRRLPYEKIADVQPVSLAAPGVAVEQLLGLTFNSFDPSDPYLYAADSLQLRVIRIDVASGRREVIASNPHLFNFPSSATFLPPVRGISPLIVVSNQQHRTTLTNDAIAEDVFEPPFIATEVLVR